MLRVRAMASQEGSAISVCEEEDETSAGEALMTNTVNVDESIGASASILKESALRAADVRAVVAALQARIAIREVMNWPADPDVFLPGTARTGDFYLAPNLVTRVDTDSLLDVWERLEELTSMVDQGCRRLLDVGLAADADVLPLLVEHLRTAEASEQDAVLAMQEALRAAVQREVQRVAPTGVRVIAARARGNPWLEVARIFDREGHVLFHWETDDDVIAIDSYDDVMPVGTPLELDEYSPLTGIPASLAVEFDLTSSR